jgi:hypothetical protein
MVFSHRLVENFDLPLEVLEMVGDLGRRDFRFKGVKLARQLGEVFLKFWSGHWFIRVRWFRVITGNTIILSAIEMYRSRNRDKSLFAPNQSCKMAHPISVSGSTSADLRRERDVRNCLNTSELAGQGRFVPWGANGQRRN